MLLASTGASCTVRPLYGPVEEGATDPPRLIALSPIGGRNGYLFREALRRRFTLDDTASARLQVDLDIEQRGLAITRVGDTTRFNIDGTARFVLTRDGETEPMTGVLRSISGYDTLESPYATRVARDAAEARVINDLAERLFAQIALRSARRT
jgi:LPS-assembly lipoprotein